MDETPVTVDAAAPPPGRADDKDWTWVLDRRCPDCGADVRALSFEEVATANRANAAGWAEILGRDDRWVRTRPATDVWSPLEYGCHVRDVLRLFKIRLEAMLTEDNPMFANWNPNETAEAERYDLAEPPIVAGELLVAAEELAAAFSGLTDEQGQRPGRRSDGAAFTVISFARYEIHDPIHHLWDVNQSA